MPLNGLDNAASAFRYWERKQEIAANNLAKVSTDGHTARRGVARILDGVKGPVAQTGSDYTTGNLRQTDDVKRGVNFKGDISVRVVSIDRAGLLRIESSKVVDVDKNKQSLNFTGSVRPEDISPQNYVGSERVADAALTFSLMGDIGKTRGGLIGRLSSTYSGHE
jgi:flagellar basal body L-ring protein FlgH